MYTKITLNKLTDAPVPGDKKPSHNLVASDNNFQNKAIVGSLWLKQGQNGNFLSGEMKKNKTYEGKEYDGYVIITEKEWNEYQTLKSSPSVKVGGYTGEVATGEVPVADIRF